MRLSLSVFMQASLVEAVSLSRNVVAAVLYFAEKLSSIVANMADAQNLKLVPFALAFLLLPIVTAVDDYGEFSAEERSVAEAAAAAVAVTAAVSAGNGAPNHQGRDGPNGAFLGALWRGKCRQAPQIQPKRLQPFKQ